MCKKIHLYVGSPGSWEEEKVTVYRSVNQALEALKEISPIAESVREEIHRDPKFPAPDYDVPEAVIHIAEGIYREQIEITRPKVTLNGAGIEKTILVFHLGAFEKLENGENRGTFRTPSVYVEAPDFTAKNLTFQNDAGYGAEVGQALAIYMDGDRAYFENCAFLASQDTIFTAPLPFKEAKTGGFRGPGEFKKRVINRQCYRNCYIRGDVDFIFGSAICYFEGCTIFSQKPKRIAEHEKVEGQMTCGYITAASTYEGCEFGYVLKNCKLESDCPTGTVYLGRPWREWAKTVYLNCEMGEHIHPEGWTDWGKTHGHFYYGEYKCFGPGAKTENRVDYAHQLTDEEARKYTADNVLQGWKP